MAVGTEVEVTKKLEMEMKAEKLKELQPSATVPEPLKEVTFAPSVPKSPTPPPARIDLQRELSFSSFSSISYSFLTRNEATTNGLVELDKSDNGK